MGRPAQFNRNNALQVAMDEFWRHGYEATSVKSLSEILGITRSSFYNSFGSRDALFIEALALYNSQSPDHAFGEARRGVPVKKLITQVFKAACHARATDPETRGCLFVCSVAELSN
ncbi:MAG: TetR/AcrR family transcriptional regulator, partial [Parvibaculaceae bacterium]|nr:TetR/AcrR family transcriptional regulator [Parvibaculaceae bacterium]